MPAFQPYRGKPAVRNDRGDGGNVGIIRSPLRATVLPDCGGRSAMVVPTATLGLNYLTESNARRISNLAQSSFGWEPACFTSCGLISHWKLPEI
jgi:hypothetical protein